MGKIQTIILLAVLVLSSCKTDKDRQTDVSATVKDEVSMINYTCVKRYPHDKSSFTEGFLFHDGILYESSGATEDLPQTRSMFGVVDLSTGKITIKAEIDKADYFGEGITFLKGKVYQLTYQSRVGFVYDATTFKEMKEFTIPSKEGWGMTTDGTNLIMSDGSSVLSYLDPESLGVVKKLVVTENGCGKNNLNELEYIKGYIYANIWMTNIIVKIDPSTGKIVGKLDLTSLADESKHVYPSSMEMNGIAYDPQTDKILVTGKMWPQIYEIKFAD